jgi:hypothetical protein
LNEIDWTAIFDRRPDLAPPGYYEAMADAKVISEKRYAIHGRKRAKGSGSSKPRTESRQAADARRNKFPSMKHGQQD